MFNSNFSLPHTLTLQHIQTSTTKSASKRSASKEYKKKRLNQIQDEIASIHDNLEKREKSQPFIDAKRSSVHRGKVLSVSHCNPYSVGSSKLAWAKSIEKIKEVQLTVMMIA